jgi:hypothetical protein
MATALTLVNAVLRRLREPQVTGFSNAYAALILDFVNETMTEVENAWRWTMLRQTLTITTSAGVQTYALTGSGQQFQFQDRDSRMFNSTAKGYIYPMPGDVIEEYKWVVDTTPGIPSNYSVSGQSGDDAQIQFWPVPDGAYTIKVPVFIPDAELVNTNDVVNVPQNPIILGAWARAISERGEDQGFKTTDQYVMYQNALSFEIALDVARVPDELVWKAD